MSYSLDGSSSLVITTCPSSYLSLVLLPFLSDPPDAPRLSIGSSSTSSLLLSWEAKESNPILGFYLYHKSESTDWEEVTLPSKTSDFNLTGLSCGRRYHLYLIAFNDAGRGPPSEVISAKTDGSCQFLYLTLHSTVFLLFNPLFPFSSFHVSSVSFLSSLTYFKVSLSFYSIRVLLFYFLKNHFIHL